MKRKNTKKIILCCCLAGILLITSAFAILHASDSRVNRFKQGNLTLELTETSWSEINAVDMLPNTYVDKNPKIHNNKDDISAWVSMSVKVPSTDVPYEVPEETPYTTGADGTVLSKGTDSVHYDLFQYTVNSGWELVAIDTSKRNETNGYTTYYYVYTNGALDADQTTDTALFDGVRLINIAETPEKNSGSIDVRCYAIQENSVANEYQAWAILSNQNNYNSTLDYYKPGYSVTDNIASYTA